VLDFAGGGEGLAVAALLVGLGGVLELFRAAGLEGERPAVALTTTAVVLCLLGAWWPDLVPSPWLSGLLTALLIGLFCSELRRATPRPARVLGAALLGAAYLGWLLSFVLHLRRLGAMAEVSPWVEAQPYAPWAVMTVFVVTWATDTFAYFAGRGYGRRKLAPHLSPGKTVEGALGGLAGAVASALVMGTWTGLGQPRDLWGTVALHSLALGLLLGIAAQAGDLFASSLKREWGVKDFGGLLPGHGGLLDRFDSLLFTAPIAYYYLTLVVGLR
jgi:phosphatidate cytidylyltransferase